MVDNPIPPQTSEPPTGVEQGPPVAANRVVDGAPVVDTRDTTAPSPFVDDSFRGPGLDVTSLPPGTGEAGTNRALDDQIASIEQQIETEQKRGRLLEATARLNALRTGGGNVPVVSLPNPLPNMDERKAVFCERCGGNFQVRADQAERKAIYDCPFCRFRHESSTEAIMESIKPGA